MYGQKIKELRVEKGWTQLQLAEMISSTQSTIGKYEREELQPNIEVLKKLCKVFEVSSDFLIGMDE